jgi:hypothetical protein
VAVVKAHPPATGTWPNAPALEARSKDHAPPSRGGRLWLDSRGRSRVPFRRYPSQGQPMEEAAVRLAQEHIRRHQRLPAHIDQCGGAPLLIRFLPPLHPHPASRPGRGAGLHALRAPNGYPFAAHTRAVCMEDCLMLVTRPPEYSCYAAT